MRGNLLFCEADVQDCLLLSSRRRKMSFSSKCHFLFSTFIRISGTSQRTFFTQQRSPASRLHSVSNFSCAFKQIDLITFVTFRQKRKFYADEQGRLCLISEAGRKKNDREFLFPSCLLVTFKRSCHVINIVSNGTTSIVTSLRRACRLNGLSDTGRTSDKLCPTASYRRTGEPTRSTQ
jgi:hypothetical protein